MQISLRSQVIAGTAAVVGASAMAMTPVLPAQLSLPSVQVPSAAQVALAGFDSPLTELLNTTVLATNFLFNSTGPFTDTPIPAPNPKWAPNFPFANFGTEFGTLPANIPNVIPSQLYTPELGGWSSVGLLPQIIDDALPIISQLGYNGSDYLQATATSLYAAGFALSEGIWNLPENVINAVEAGDFDALIDAFIGPVIKAGSQLLTAGGYVLSGVVERASAVLETVVDLAPVLLGATIGQISVLAGSVVAVVENFVDAFGTSNPIENAWNAVVNGLLGPSGIPGTLINLTLGAGVQTGPIAFNPDPDVIAQEIAENFVPSVRTVVQAGVKAIAGALATPVTPLGAAATPAAARTVAPAAAVETVVEAPAEAPAAEVTAADVKAEAAPAEAPAEVKAPAAGDNSSATAGDSDSSAKPATKHRVSRKAASND